MVRRVARFPTAQVSVYVGQTPRPYPLLSDEAPTLSALELRQLYATNIELTEHDVRHIDLGLPDSTRLPGP